MPQRWHSTGRMNTLLELLLNISEMILLKCGKEQTRVGIFSNIDKEQNIPVPPKGSSVQNGYHSWY